ncbi:helix-turn-helix domain-containing protein, partial [Tenuifilum sp.]|uniref:helix-turn-helix domain-containing protein n=1 Tax=Tenuifilum sp. TaxID=2760880 RepID=UPI002C409740|nr:helix-turn-helix domain-containing protein [Tenuifilum sp.]
KFATDFAEKYRMPAIALDDEARKVLISYYWPGNVRQLKNVTEQISIIEQKRVIDSETLLRYLPDYNASRLPTLYHKKGVVDEQTFATEREILYKILYDMRSDMNELKKLVFDLMRNGVVSPEHVRSSPVFQDLGVTHVDPIVSSAPARGTETKSFVKDLNDIQDTEEIQEETLSLEEKEKELIVKALEKHNGRRKWAAMELGISERTLYRKIKEYNINL